MKIIKMNTLMEHLFKSQEYMVYILVLYIDKNAGIYGPKTMYFRILSACQSIIAGYFSAFLRVSVLNHMQHILKMKYTQVQSAPEEQTA